MTIEYKKYINYSEEILVRKFEGKIHVEDIIGSWKYLIENNMITDNHKGVITDVCKCELDFKQESFRKLLEYIKKNPLLKELKHAVVCDSPNNIVFPYMAEDERDLNVKPFSTFESATNWILT